MSTVEPFGFFVKKVTEDIDDDGVWGPFIPPRWKVGLPHRCDDWMIAGDEYGASVTRADAVAELERFITEAQIALDALKSDREIGES